MGAVICDGMSHAEKGFLRNPSRKKEAVMRWKRFLSIVALVSAVGLGIGVCSMAQSNFMVQCPADNDGIDADGDGDPTNDIVCKHLTAGDGFATMADGTVMYTFGFSEVPEDVPPGQVFALRQVKAELPGPTIVLREGQELYLNLTNVGMINRPDLFDTHSVHWHGIPNSGSIFDGLPESAPTVKIGATFPYYYATLGKEGTYFYHCHVEVTEHMQMGMIGQIYVLPRQDQDMVLRSSGNPPYAGFAYNDGDGSTGYHVSKAIQLAGFDSRFHAQHIAIQNLPFAQLKDDYHLMNGRGYPDTINPNLLGASPENNGHFSQRMDARIQARQGERVLLRVHNISTTHLFTVRVLGIPMKVVGIDGKLLRNGSKDLFYETSSLTIGGGQAADLLLDTTGVPPGTYFFYTTNLSELINGQEERGGIMTEIVVCPASGCGT